MLWHNPKLTKWYKTVWSSKWKARLTWGIPLTLGGLLYVKVWLPLTGLGIPCPFHAVTGLYCPGCGMTRVVESLLQLDIQQAIHYNLLLFLLLPLYVLYMIAKKMNMTRTNVAIMLVMLTLTITFGIARNTPMFEWLAPIDYVVAIS